MPPEKRLTQRDEFRRLLRYVAPHSALLAAGVALLAFMAAVDGLVVLSIRPAVDVVLTPSTWNQRLALFTVPWGGPTIYLNSFVPSRVHHVWSVFALALIFLFCAKGLAEFFGITLIQYVGLASVTDLRNHVYARVVQQPVGFFHHNPVGRVMSAVMSDIEQMRSAFSDYLADFFRQIFTLICLRACSARDQLETGVGIGAADSPCSVAGQQIGSAHPPGRPRRAGRGSRTSARFCRRRSAAIAS